MRPWYYEFKQLLIQIASNKLSSSLLKQNQVCGGTMIDKTYNIIPSEAKASFLAWMYQFSIQSVRSSISFATFNLARTAGLGFMNLLLSPFAAPWLVQNEEFKAPLQDRSC